MRYGRHRKRFATYPKKTSRYTPLQPFANHLWQSTLFVALASLLTLALRKDRAQARHWLWFVASVKFLVPFSILVDLGSHLGWHTAPGPIAMIQPAIPTLIEQVSQPRAAGTLPAGCGPAFIPQVGFRPFSTPLG